MMRRVDEGERDSRQSDANRIPWIAGALLLGAACGIVAADASGDTQGSYEAGRVVGTAFGNVVIGIVVASLLDYAYRRSRGEPSSWKEINGPRLLGGGVVAVALALAIGVPEPERAGIVEAERCSNEQLNPITALPNDRYRQLSARELQELAPAGNAGVSGFRELGDIYVVQTRAGRSLTLVAAVSHSATDQRDFTASFVDTQGVTPREVSVAGRPATQVSDPSTGITAIHLFIGCYAVSVTGTRETTARKHLQTLLAGS